MEGEMFVSEEAEGEESLQERDLPGMCEERETKGRWQVGQAIRESVERESGVRGVSECLERRCFARKRLEVWERRQMGHESLESGREGEMGTIVAFRLAPRGVILEAAQICLSNPRFFENVREQSTH